MNCSNAKFELVCQLKIKYNRHSVSNELEKRLRTQYQDNQVIKTATIYHYNTFRRCIHKHSESRNFTQSSDKLRQTKKTQHQHTHMLWDRDLPIQEYSDTHIYTTINDQGSFKPVARLAWLRDDIPQPVNDEPENDKGWYGKNKTDVRKGIQVYHYHNDQLGTPNELTNDKGEVVWLADYQAWGNTAKVIWREQLIDQMQVSQDELQPIRFQGQHLDTETGLHYNRFRYYDPDIGMFTSRDPIELDGGINVFAYAPNPTGWIDPLGLAAGTTTGGLGKAATTVLKVGRGIPGVIWQAITPTKMGDAVFYPTKEQMENASVMAAAGNQADSAIKDAWTHRNDRCTNCKEPDRCKWLKANAHLFPKAAVNATEKAWGCKHSRHSKDKIKNK